MDAIDPAIEVVRVDTPGVGGSPAAFRPSTFPELAWTMTRLLDQLGYGQVDVLGYSWGGALAQQFAALEHPSDDDAPGVAHRDRDWRNWAVAQGPELAQFCSFNALADIVKRSVDPVFLWHLVMPVAAFCKGRPCPDMAGPERAAQL